MSLKVGEISDKDFVATIRQLCSNVHATFATFVAFANMPTGILMMISAYARPWYHGAYRFGARAYDNKGYITKSVSLRFDVKEKKWIELTHMTVPRFTTTATIHSETSSILICGGYGENGKVLSTVERYSIINDTWSTMPSMRFARFDHTAVEWNGLIFIIGGYGPRGTMSSCEMFNITSNVWNDLPDMQVVRREHSSVAIGVTSSTSGAGAHVYAIGGWGTKSVERYDIVAKKWNRIADLLNVRNNHSSIVLATGGSTQVATIFVIGGQEKDGGYMGYCTDVEQYDINENKWINASWKMSIPLISISAHILNDRELLLCGDRIIDDGNAHICKSLCLRVRLEFSNGWKCVSINSDSEDLFVSLTGSSAC